MLLSYWLRVACLGLFSLGTIQIALHLFLRFVTRLAGRSIDKMTARRQERIRFAIPVAPDILALLLTLTVVIPQYMRNETNLLPERVGIVCFAGALAIAIRYLYAVLRASRLLRNKFEPKDAPVIMTAGLPVHRRLPADAVDLVDQVPGALVGHVHGAAGRRDRAELADILQKLDLARPDPAFGIEVDAHAERWQWRGGLFLHRRPVSRLSR